VKKQYIIILAGIALVGLYVVHSPAREVQEETNMPTPATQQLQVVTTDKASDTENKVTSVNQGVNLDVKKKRVIDLVNRGTEFFMKNSVDDSLNEFTHGTQFVEGELYLLLADVNGTLLAHGNDLELVWQNIADLKDDFGVKIFEKMITTTKKGGGWFSYQWRNATKVTYVKEIIKDNKAYVIGAGYYPQSKADAVANLVKSASAFFNEYIKKGSSGAEAFSNFSYPLGQFISGDLYLYALDFKGTIMAQGDRPGLIGQNSWDYKDSQGKFVNREIVRALKQTSGGIWIEYESKNQNKRAYAEKVADKDGREFFIACGYYPDADRKVAQDLVSRGYQYMKLHGAEQASTAFSDKRTPKFIEGDIYITVYDMKGIVRGDGENEENIGKNHYDLQDDDGMYIVKEYIRQAKDGGGWINSKQKNSFKSTYVTLVDMGAESFVIASGLYPLSKHDTMQLLAKSAVGYLQTVSDVDAFRAFVDRKGKFLRGDLEIFVFNQQGICKAFGDKKELIHNNLFNLKDDTGKPYVKQFINTAKSGPGLINYTLNNVERVAYVEQVKKDNETYVVGSAYYR